MARAYALVQRDQCNGRTLSCINCSRPLGERHDVLCYAYAIAAKKAQQERERCVICQSGRVAEGDLQADIEAHRRHASDGAR